MSQTLQFEFLAAAVGVFALVFLYVAYRLLASSGWVMGWIQGNAGLALLLLTGVLALAIMDIRTYRPMFDNVPIATLSLHTLGPDSHQLRLVNHKGFEESYPVTGDEYQLVIHQFKWATRFSGMGLGHGYRVDHLVNINSASGAKTNVTVSSSDHVDVWRFFHNKLSPEFLISAHTIETLPRKVIDGGMYELIPDAFDINVVALNQVAKEADAVEVPAVEAPAPALDVAPVIETVPAVTVPAPATAPAPKAPVINAPVVKAPEKPKVDEMPGAHIQATPATMIEKPADQKTN